MADGELFEKLEHMVESDDLTLKQGVRLLMQGVVEIYKKMEVDAEWKKSTENRIEKLESKDTRFVALVAGGASIIGAAIGVIGILLATT